jgi:hypothetical protein
MLPEVERLPLAKTVKVEVPLFWIAKEVSVAALVSLMIKAVAVPALVKVNEVAVASPEERVNATFLPVVVAMVLPPLYAVWSVIDEPLHLVTLLDPSTHRAVPAVPGVVKPGIFKNEVPLVLIVTLDDPGGVKVAAPLAVIAPVNVDVPVTANDPPKEVAPVPTVKVLVPVTEVAPLREIAPVPVLNVPAPVWETLPEVVIPVAPVIAPDEESTKVGVLMKLVKPVAEAKFNPLIILVLLFVAAGKLIPFKVLELLVLVEFAKVMFVPLTVVAVTEVLELVTDNA